MNYLDFKSAQCKDCYKCLRNCPVNAIKVVNYQAQIIKERCILCGKCTLVCPQNAKEVHDSTDDILKMLEKGPCFASIAPSFTSSFNINDFEAMKKALKLLGFVDAEETSVGAYMVSKEYLKLLKSGKYKNLISSSCPAVNNLITHYYPDAIKYLAPVVTPMVAHGKIIKKRENNPDLKVIFIGPCIAKKKEGDESGVIDGVLTFEELMKLFELHHIDLHKIESELVSHDNKTVNKAKFYPIPTGIIASFGDDKPDNYDYVAVDGTKKCKDVLNIIDQLDGMFLELNSCEDACVNGPCSGVKDGHAVISNSLVRKYANLDIKRGGTSKLNIPDGIDYSYEYKPVTLYDREVSEEEIKEILLKTNKHTKEDELNCGACGYDTCRKKAWAVANGYADVEMCLPYMREKAESMSYQIIQNMPNGIIVVDYDYKVLQINSKVSELLSIPPENAKGMYIFDLIDSTYIIESRENKQNIYRKRLKLQNSDKEIEMTVINLVKDNVIFAVLKDITEKVKSEKKMTEMRANTLSITNDVIEKQMRVAQEIASVLGETVAETKVAVLNLQKSLVKENDDKKGDK